MLVYEQMLNSYILTGYAIFLGVMLLINLLYFLQIFKYRLPGDASIPVLIIHIILLLSVLAATTVYIGTLA